MIFYQDLKQTRHYITMDLSTIVSGFIIATIIIILATISARADCLPRFISTIVILIVVLGSVEIWGNRYSTSTARSTG